MYCNLLLVPRKLLQRLFYCFPAPWLAKVESSQKLNRMWFFRHFSRPICSTVAETIGVTNNAASFGKENVQKTTFEVTEMMLGPWNQQLRHNFMSLMYVHQLSEYPLLLAVFYFLSLWNPPLPEIRFLLCLLDYILCWAHTQYEILHNHNFGIKKRGITIVLRVGAILIYVGGGYSEVGILRTGTELENKFSRYLQVRASFA